MRDHKTLEGKKILENIPNIFYLIITCFTFISRVIVLIIVESAKPAIDTLMCIPIVDVYKPYKIPPNTRLEYSIEIIQG